MSLSQNYFDVKNVSPGEFTLKAPRKRLNSKKPKNSSVVLDEQVLHERRERNRVAAQTCRQRKQMYIKSLEEHISKLEKCLDFFKCIHIEDASFSVVTHDASVCPFPNSPLSQLQTKGKVKEEEESRIAETVNLNPLNSDLIASQFREIDILNEKFNNSQFDEYDEFDWIDIEDDV